MGCYNPPTKKKFVPRFTRGGGAQENDGHIDHGEQQISGQLNGGNFSVSHVTFPSKCMGNRAHYRI
jgi:hypothetical protein